MAILPKIAYNFNEGSATTIRDYADGGGNDGVGSGLTNSSSSRVGNEVIFNLGTDQINSGNITILSSQPSMACHIGLQLDSAGLLTNICSKSGQLEITTVSGNITVNLFVATGTATVSNTLNTGTYEDIDIVYSSNILTLYIDGVSVATDDTKSGNIASDESVLYFGNNPESLSSASFRLNEFKLYDTSITTTIIDSVIAEQNGINSDSREINEFSLGDIIGSDLFGSPKYGIVTFVGTETDFRFLPLSDNISGGMGFARVGHLWDTDRQWQFKIDDTPELCFYDAISQSSEVLTAAKKIYCLSKNGIIDSGQTKTTDYTLIDTDSVIFVDTSSGDITITFPVAPITSKRYEIIKITNDQNKIILDGNGKNINGNTTLNVLSGYDAITTIYTGTEHIVD